MINKIMFVVLLGFMSAQYAEIDIGYNRANGEFDKYNDDGFSMIGQNDKAYHVGACSGFDDAGNTQHSLYQSRINGL